MKIKFVDNSAKILSELEQKIERALTVCGGLAEEFASDALDRQGAVDTGRLRNSITSQVNEHTVTVGTPVEYAIYVEFGTGSAPGVVGGRQTEWVYMDDYGNFHRTKGMSPRPYIKPAFSEHIDVYKKAFEKYLA